MSEFRVKESHLAGFSVMTDQVDAHVASVIGFARDSGGAHGDWSGVMSTLSGPVDAYADAFGLRLIDIGIALRSMGTELNRAAWVYHGTDRSAYEKIEVIAGTSVSSGAQAWDGEREPYAPGAAPALEPPQVAEADIEAMLDDAGGLLNTFNDLISTVTGFSPVTELVEPLSGNWNALSGAGEALMSAGDACEQIADSLEASVSKLGGSWDGAAATSFEGFAADVIAGLRAEGPLNRTVGRAYVMLATQIERAASYVVETLSSICQQLAERAATSWVPVYGQYKLIRFLESCIGILNDMKRLVEDVKSAVETAKGVVDAAKDPVKYVKGRIQDQLQPVLDQLQQTQERGEAARDLVSIKPIDLKNVPDAGDGYQLPQKPERDG